MTIDGPNGPLRVPSSVAAQLALSSNVAASAPSPDVYAQGQRAGGGPAPLQVAPGGPPVEETAGPTPAAQPTSAQMTASWPASTTLAKAPTTAADAEPAVDAVSQPGGVVAQAPAPRPAPQQPGARPVTTSDLQKGGYAGALNQQETANQGEIAAANRVADAQAIGQVAVADAFVERNKKLDQLFEDRARTANADLQALQARTAQYDAAAKRYADVKIDRSADHPLLAMIGIALSGWGAAKLGKDTNPAIDALYKSIDRKVAGQMADLEQRGKVLGLQKDAIASMREAAKDNLALKNLMISGESERSARLVEEITTRSSSDVLRAKGAEFAAQLRARGADQRMHAVDLQTKADQHAAEIKQRNIDSQRTFAASMAHTNESKRQFDLTLLEKAAERDKDLAIAIANANAKGKGDKATALAAGVKENEQRGVGNAALGGYVLNKTGREQMKQADALEQQAVKLDATNKGAADAARTRAAEIRAEAQNLNVFRLASPDDKIKFTDDYAGAQSMIKLGDDIKRAYDKFGKAYLKTDQGQAAIKSKIIEYLMTLKDAWHLGVLSKNDILQVGKAIGEDPTEWNVSQIAFDLTKEFGEDPDNFKARLDSLADGAQSRVYARMRARGYDGDVKDLFVREKEGASTAVNKQYQAALEEQTPAEVVKGAESNRFVEGAQKVFYDATSKDVLAGEAANSPFYSNNPAGGGSVSNPHLTTKQVDFVTSAVTAQRKGDKTANELLVDAAIDQTRPSFAYGVMVELRTADPELYKQLRSRVSGDVAANLAQDEELASAHAGYSRSTKQAKEVIVDSESYDRLAGAALAGDRDSFVKLSEKAAGGDAAAQKWLDATINLRAQRGAPSMAEPRVDPQQRLRDLGWRAQKGDLDAVDKLKAEAAAGSAAAKQYVIVLDKQVRVRTADGRYVFVPAYQSKLNGNVPTEP